MVINVYDNNTRNIFAPFYHIKYGNYDTLINKINTNIKKELKKLGIKEEEGHGSKCKSK